MQQGEVLCGAVAQRKRRHVCVAFVGCETASRTVRTHQSIAATAVAAAAVATATAVTTAAAFTTTTAAAAVATAAAFTATAAEAAATTTVAAAAIATTVGAAETSRTLFTGASFVDHDGATGHGLTVQAVDGGLRFSVRAHFNETEALGAAGFTVHHDLGRADSAEFAESFLQILIAHAVGQIAHVKFVAHERAPFKVTMRSFNPSGPIPKTVSLPDTDENIMVEGFALEKHLGPKFLS